MSTAKPFDARTAFQRMRERTREAREHEAGVLFSANNIDAVLSAAATKGQSAAIFAPSQPMDLSDTDTAKAMVALFHKAGFSAEWVTRQRPDEEPARYLRVSWGNEAKPR